MRLEEKKHLFDILSAIGDIGSFVCGLDYKHFQVNEIVKAAVERKLEIIGEALNRLLRIDPELFDQITNARRIVGFRNILAHGYDIVDDAIVWEVVNLHLPVLKAEIEETMEPGGGNP